MGPLELTDLVGLDVRCDILNNLAESFADESYRPHPLLVKHVEAGDLGKKSGKGFYDWTSGGLPWLHDASELKMSILLRNGSPLVDKNHKTLTRVF